MINIQRLFSCQYDPNYVIARAEKILQRALVENSGCSHFFSLQMKEYPFLIDEWRNFYRSQIEQVFANAHTKEEQRLSLRKHIMRTIVTNALSNHYLFQLDGKNTVAAEPRKDEERDIIYHELYRSLETSRANYDMRCRKAIVFADADIHICRKIAKDLFNDASKDDYFTKYQSLINLLIYHNQQHVLHHAQGKIYIFDAIVTVLRGMEKVTEERFGRGEDYIPDTASIPLQ